jgi:hypothetical protein
LQELAGQILRDVVTARVAEHKEAKMLLLAAALRLSSDHPSNELEITT